MSDCLFCKIVDKEIPAAVVYEDDVVIGFLDIHPVVPGHTLVVPKEHSDNLTKASDASLTALTLAVKRIAQAVCQAVGCEGWNLHVNTGKTAGQAVMHTHWHIIPRHADDGLVHWPHRGYEPGEMERTEEAIKKHL